MRRFTLEREVDETGISGQGTVVEGFEFDGGIWLRWLTSLTSICWYASAEHVEAIHGHGGKTRLVWSDEPVTAEYLDRFRTPEVPALDIQEPPC